MHAPPKPEGPTLDPDHEPPGRVINGHWEGALDWCTRHGPALVQWSLGVPTYFWNALGPEGNRLDLHGRYPASYLFRLDDGSSLVRGEIEIGADDVVFMPVQQLPDPDIDEGLRPLFERLRSDEAFVRDLAIAANAGALYAILENEEFVTEDKAIFEFGQRSAAHFVAALRACGEDYLDYAWGRGTAFAQTDTERVRAHFKRMRIVPRELEV